MNICEELEEELDIIDPDDQDIKLVEYFTKEKYFGRILLEEEYWDEEEELVCTTTQPATQVYQRRNKEKNITPFLDKHKNLEEEELEERDLCDYDLGIDIEQELHKVMQNVSLGELVKLPFVKDQVQRFFDNILVANAPEIVYESCHIQSVRGREVEVDPPI